LHHALEFLQGDLRLGALHPEGLRYTGVLQALGISDPRLGQKQPQDDWDRHLTLGERERDQALTIRILAHHSGVLRGDAHGMAALLEQGRVVDHQDRV
jgi:hypothetical protein